jgi:hypothetical protein
MQKVPEKKKPSRRSPVCMRDQTEKEKSTMAEISVDVRNHVCKVLEEVEPIAVLGKLWP